MLKTSYLRAVTVLIAVLVAAGLLLVLVGTKPAEAAFPGNNGKIAFSSNRTAGPGVDNPTEDFEIFTMNVNGSAVTQLTFNTADDQEPVFSPNGEQIAFHTNRDGNYEIYTMDADGSNQINRSKNSWSDYRPVYSPDGKQIAFERRFESAGGSSNYLLYTMDDSGANQINIINFIGDAQRPAWSPDGSRIAFQNSGLNGNSDIFTISPTGTDLTQITKNPANELDPNWSPDGTKIAFVSDRTGNFDIFKMKAKREGRKNRPVRLTSDTLNDTQPAWSPDGRKITFTRGFLGDEIYVMGAGGAAQINMTNDVRTDVSSDWQPLS